MNGTGRLRRGVVYSLVSVVATVLLSIAFSGPAGASAACCTIPPPPPCETHPEMCV